MPDRTPVRPKVAVAMLIFGLLLLVGGVIGAVTHYPVRSTLSSTAIIGVLLIAMAGSEVARPTADRTAVLIYRTAFFLLPVAVFIALMIGDSCRPQPV